jgi:DNA polymerase-3 subunit epsilon
MTTLPGTVRLADDLAFATVEFWVIDFEATTPAGHRPQAVEVAVLDVRHVPVRGPRPGGFRFGSLIRPPGSVTKRHSPDHRYPARGRR